MHFQEVGWVYIFTIERFFLIFLIQVQKWGHMLGVVANALNPSTSKTGEADLCEFKANLSVYIVISRTLRVT